jgi:hypothetical protein
MSLLSQFYGGDSVGSNLGSYPGIYASDPVSNIYPPTLCLSADFDDFSAVSQGQSITKNVVCPDPYRTVTFSSYRLVNLASGYGGVAGSFVTKIVDVWYASYLSLIANFTITGERLENIDGLNIETNNGGIVSIANCPLLTTITRIGIFKTMNTYGTPLQIYFNNNALNQSSVDAILVAIAAGRDLVTDPLVAGFRSVNIGGGTNSPPGSAGLAAKATLVAAGWTVTNN